MKRPRMLNERENHTARNIVFAVVIVIFLAVLSFELWLYENCFLVEISGNSMDDTVHDGDVVFTRYAKEGMAQRGDVVILDVKRLKEQYAGIREPYFVKRLIATEGDTVRISEGAVWLKYAGEEEFTRLSEDYAKGTTEAHGSPQELVVGEGQIFVLGDNRTVSADSRSFGCFYASEISGVVPAWSIAIKGLTTKWG